MLHADGYAGFNRLYEGGPTGGALHAEQVALDLMAQRRGFDWSAWYVEVYYETGRAVMAKAFADIRHERSISRRVQPSTR